MTAAPFLNFITHPAYYNDFDENAVAWLKQLIAQKHIAPGEVDARSILDVTPDDVRGFTQCHFFAGIGGWSLALRLAGFPDHRQVWTGSAPCQPFSVAGRQDGLARKKWRAPTEEPGGVLWETGTDRGRSFGVKRCGWH